MRSWENRSDTYVCDEPLYAHYLNETRLDHPGRDEVIASQSTQWETVIDWLTGPIPAGKTVFYQKHMTHHLLPNIGRDWLSRVSNVFLIRDPRDMITSLAKVLPEVRLTDTGMPQQWEIYQQVKNQSGVTPVVVDARDVQNHPKSILSQLCQRLEIEFDPAMLQWPPGPRSTDGIWAKYWYANVEKTTGFEPYQSKNEPVPDTLSTVLEECIAIYDQLAISRIKP